MSLRNHQLRLRKIPFQTPTRKERLREPDWLIDQIVYKLYRLTEEEMKIMEGSHHHIKEESESLD